MTNYINNVQIIKKACCIVLLILGIVALAGCGNKADDSIYTTNYDGQEYAALEYPVNIFYYDYNGNSHDNFAEVDGKYPIDSPLWDMIWNAGDLYCISDRAEEAKEYYANDENYVWYVLIDTDEEDNEINSCPIDITAAELEQVYDIENQERDLALFFEDFEEQGSLFKISKDGVVRGTISLCKYKGAWYWKSEVIDESVERDGTWPEYVQPLPQSLSSKIIETE